MDNRFYFPGHKIIFMAYVTGSFLNIGKLVVTLDNLASAESHSTCMYAAIGPILVCLSYTEQQRFSY